MCDGVQVPDIDAVRFSLIEPPCNQSVIVKQTDSSIIIVALMVMHARKLPRLNDGYFDRNASHLHQGSGKYKVSEDANHSNSNGPTSVNRSSDNSPERSHNNRYINKTTYMQRMKEREKEKQDRESSHSPMFKLERSNNSSSSSSIRRDIKESDHRSNHSRNISEDSKERRVQVGDWSEHISSSGKKYYYNCKTEVSQWEKPKSWLEWERAHGLPRSNHCDQFRHKHSQGFRASNSKASEKHSTGLKSVSASHNHVNNSNNRLDDRHSLSNKVSRQTYSSVSNSSIPPKSLWNNENNNVSSVSNVRLSENINRRVDIETQDMDISPTSGDDTPTSSQQEQSPSRQQQTPTSSQQQVSLAVSLPKLLSQLASGNKTNVSNFEKTELSAHEALRTIKQALELSRHAKQSSSPSGTSSQENASPSSSNQLNQLAATIHHALEARIAAAAPPRLSEPDCRGSPGSESSHKSVSKKESPTSSVSSLHSLSVSNSTNGNSISVGPTSSLASLKPQTISLTPSLANYYGEDLINHVTGWPAEQVENQANKSAEEAFLIGSLNCTKVSAELKTCRSYVRLAEIQATLQEQKILFIRQHIKELEVWKSQNLFMSDS